MINKIIAIYFLKLANLYQDQVLSKLGTPSPKIRAYNEAVVIFCYRSAIKLNPNFSEAHYQLGLLLAKQRKWQQAVDSFRQAIENNYPYLFRAYFHLGRMLVKQKKWQQAVESFGSVLKLEPNHLWSRICLGDALNKVGKSSEAIQVYKSAIELKSNDIKSRIYLGNSLSGKGEIYEAIQIHQNTLYQELNKTHPHFKLRLHKAQQLSVPNFLIIGQAKCGTTSLYGYLTQHLHILPALTKEIYFWNNLSYFSRGLDWYLAYFPPICIGQNFITGEATPLYFDSSEAAQRLVQIFPQMKLIVLLRNPVNRAISQYYMNFRRRDEERNLETAFFSELEILTQKREVELDKLYYLPPGIYINSISRWMEIFPKEQFLILQSEDFFADPATTVNQVFQFLEVEPYQLKEYRNKNQGRYPPISNSIRRTLIDYFRPYNQKLEEYLDRKFHWDYD